MSEKSKAMAIANAGIKFSHAIAMTLVKNGTNEQKEACLNALNDLAKSLPDEEAKAILLWASDIKKGV